MAGTRKPAQIGFNPASWILCNCAGMEGSIVLVTGVGIECGCDESASIVIVQSRSMRHHQSRQIQLQLFELPAAIIPVLHPGVSLLLEILMHGRQQFQVHGKGFNSPVNIHGF